MLSLFQPKCDDTHELASKVMFYFHPKVSNGVVGVVVCIVGVVI